MPTIDTPRRLTHLLILVCSVSFMAGARAQTANDDVWKASFTPYIWFANITNDLDIAGIDNISATVPFGDLIDMMDFAWMSYFEASKGQWGFANDTFYIKISSESKVYKSAANPVDARFNGTVKASFSEAMSDFMLSYRFVQIPEFTLYAGIRYILLRSTAFLG